MNRAIRQHIELVERRLAALEEGPDGPAGTDRAGESEPDGVVESGPADLARRAAELRCLAAYHDAQTRNFQHERLIHLLVTLFFAAVWAGAVVALVLYLVSGAEPDGLTMPGLVALCVVLTGLEVAYIGHYYHLENNVQALYRLTTKLFEAADRAG
ncbi:MAG: hypothetical protein LBJ02_01695 [Bifidobacteriaceae bacterium]|nr:hypothetical protein [Bifidobacteriaceae bacterium]